MVNRPKNIGTAAETAVVRYLRAHGFMNVKRLTLQGAGDIGDISLGDGWPITIEVKGGHAAENASDGLVLMWIDELHREMIHAGNPIGALVLKRKGKSAANAGTWYVHMDMECYLAMLGVDTATKGELATVGGVMTMSLEMFGAIVELRAYALLKIGGKHG